MLGPCWGLAGPVLGHPSEVLSMTSSAPLVVVRTELVRASPFGVRVPVMTIKIKKLTFTDQTFYHTSFRLTQILSCEINMDGKTVSNSPVVIGAMTSVISVIVILVVRPLPGGAAATVTARAAIGVSMGTTVAIVMVLVSWLVIRVMSIPLPGLVAVSRITVFTFSLPVSPICNERTNTCMFLE